MVASPNIRLTLSNRAENVLIVRQMLGAWAAHSGLQSTDLNDLLTAVSEACNNVVLHAYGGQEGPLEVDLFAGSDATEVVVRDRGGGMDNKAVEAVREPAGIGISVIDALVQSSQRAEDGGVELRMSFATPGSRELESPAATASPLLRQLAREELAGAVALEVAPDALARAILPRMLAVLAAQAHFPVETLIEVERCGDALLAGAAAAAPRARPGILASAHSGALFVRLGPLPAGSAGKVRERAGRLRSSSLASLCAEPLATSEAGELLGVRLDRPAI